MDQTLGFKRSSVLCEGESVMDTSRSRSIPRSTFTGIRWTQVLSLLGLDLAILLSWMGYNEYQPRLVERFGYGRNAFAFLVVQTLIMVVTPPVAGYLTDRLLAHGGVRLVVVNLGIAMAAMVFMATALAVTGQPGAWITALFPVLIVLWLISMNIFHSPAISMLELYAPPNLLTAVASLFTLLAGLTAALEPSMTVLIDSLGAPLTFAAGGIAVFVAGSWFLRSSRNIEVQRESDSAAAPETSEFALILAMGLGLGLGVGEAIMNDLLPRWIAVKGDLSPGYGPAGQSSFLYALSALVAWPLGMTGNRFTAEWLALIGGLGMLLLGSAAWLLPPPMAHAVLWIFPAVYSALAVASLPVAFARLRPGHKVLGVGLLFSGVELAVGLVKIALNL